jgi:opacity protein-like surface antigen
MVAGPRTLQVLLIAILCNLASSAQTTGSSPQNQAPEGVESGGYVLHQSIELGYRGSDVTGSQQMYDTLVNLRSGPRFLDQTLSMQSQAHDGLLFDNLFVTSFGWGGDPNNALRARVDKNKWYDFTAAFRRDQTDFNYNLLANPLNPPTSSPNLPVTASPHSFYTRRRMSDFDLTLLPQSKIDFRVGYSHNNTTGPSFSSVHEGTDALLSQAWNTTTNSYRFGVDLKLLPRTVVSYDQFLDYYKGDTLWNLAAFAPANLPGGGTVELGLPINTVNRNPCAIVPPSSSLIDPTGTLTNLACNAFFGYNRSNRTRTSMPTERLSLRSAWERVEFSASYAYSSAKMTAPLDEFFNGLIQRSGIRQETVTGPADATRVSNVADFTLAVHLFEHLRLVNTFRFWSYRIPERFASLETDWGCTVSSSCTLITPINGGTVISVTPTLDQLSFNQNWKRNETSLVWDAKHLGARVGFRYGDKAFHHVLDFITGDEDRVTVHEYTPLVGFWAKPTAHLRFNVDWEHTNNTDAIVRIGVRKESRLRVQANYTPRPWAVLGVSMNVWEGSNGNALINFRGHNRSYGFTATLSPKERVSIETSYNYNDYQQNAFICFENSDTTLPVVSGAGSCVANGYNDSDNPLLTYGSYSSRTHYGMTSLMFKPWHRVTTQMGYSIISVGGETPQFNSLQPFGSLQYNYHQPLAAVAVDVGHNVALKAGWNYFQYGEKSFVGPTDPRYFHANNATLSLRWAF